MANLLVWNIQQLSTPKINRQQFGHYLHDIVGGAFSALLILELTKDEDKAKIVVNWFKELCEGMFKQTWQSAISQPSTENNRADRCALLCHADYLTDLKNEPDMEMGDRFGAQRRPAVFSGKRGNEEVYVVGYHGPSPSHRVVERMNVLSWLATLPVLQKPNVVVAGDFNLELSATRYKSLTDKGYVSTRLQPHLGTTVKLSVPSWSEEFTTSHAYDQIFIHGHPLKAGQMAIDRVP